MLKFQLLIYDKIFLYLNFSFLSHFVPETFFFIWTNWKQLNWNTKYECESSILFFQKKVLTDLRHQNINHNADVFTSSDCTHFRVFSNCWFSIFSHTIIIKAHIYTKVPERSFTFLRHGTKNCQFCHQMSRCLMSNRKQCTKVKAINNVFPFPR